MDEIELLKNLVLSKKHLKEEDKPLIVQLCEKLRILADVRDINEYFRQQVEVEAGMVYLVGRYTMIVDKFKDVVESHKAGKSVELGERNDEGLKWTKAGKEQWLLGTDARYVALLGTLKEAERLLDLLRELSKVAFRRQDKLEQITINTRREIEADKRTSY